MEMVVDNEDSVSLDLMPNCAVEMLFRSNSEPLRRDAGISVSQFDPGSISQPTLPVPASMTQPSSQGLPPPLPSPPVAPAAVAAAVGIRPEEPEEGGAEGAKEGKDGAGEDEQILSWVTSDSQNAEVELQPYPSREGYAGREATAAACVTINDRVLYAADAVGKLERCAQKLANQGRRGRRIRELKDTPLEVQKVAIKRKRPAEEDEESAGQRRLEVTFEVANGLRGPAQTQLALEFRSGLDPPIRRNAKVRIRGSDTSSTQCPSTDG
eukprot:Hpha_TRINITY_DN16556_c1_g1::TRINITY_DN16556_c1_g1_i1::g.135726::m.135726